MSYSTVHTSILIISYIYCIETKAGFRKYQIPKVFQFWLSTVAFN